MTFLSVDVGSSRCKASVFSVDGKMLALDSVSWTPYCPRPGRAETDPEDIFQTVCRLVRGIAGISQSDSIEALCFSSHGETLIPVGEDGRPVYSAILNTDVRAIKESAWCEQQLDRQRLFSITGHASHPTFPVPKLLWLRNNEPEVFSRARWFLGVTDFLLLRLGLPPFVDYSHAARFMALDVRALAWSQEVLDIAGISLEKLSTPVQAGTIAGRLDMDAAAALGVPKGTPIVIGGHDQAVGALGLGVINAARAAGSLGTYECILAAGDQPQLNLTALDHGLNTYPHVVPGKFVTIAYFPSGIMLQWLSNLLWEQQPELEPEAHWNRLESDAPPGPTGLLITPHLIGTGNPEFNSHTSAAIYGLKAGSSRSHLYKGILEGIASELTLIVECLESAGVAFDHINVAGGGVRSVLGLQLRSALTGKFLHVMNGQESVCLGGAMIASVALHAHPNLESAAKEMVREQKFITPDRILARQYATQLAGYRRFRSLLMQGLPQNYSPKGEQS